MTAPPASINAPAETPTSGTASATCAIGQTPVGSGYHKDNNEEDGLFPLTLFLPAYGIIPTSWNVTAYSLPGIPIDSPSFAQGGSATLIPICATL